MAWGVGGVLMNLEFTQVHVNCYIIDVVGLLEHIAQILSKSLSVRNFKIANNPLRSMGKASKVHKFCLIYSVAFWSFRLSKELLQPFHHGCHHQRTDSRAGRKRKRTSPHSSRPDPSRVIQFVNENLSPNSIEYGLRIARTHVAAKDKAAEALLLTMINQCKNHPDFGIQHLRAPAELIKLYDEMGQAHQHQAVPEETLESANKTWEAYTWKKGEIESFEFMEAILQLVANLPKCGYPLQARNMFRTASDKASAVCASDDERTVWTLITIGVVYQNQHDLEWCSRMVRARFAARLGTRGGGEKMEL